MDHPLRTISYIADIGNMVVLMARRRRTRGSHDDEEASVPSQDEQRQYKMICHVFESEDVSKNRPDAGDEVMRTADQNPVVSGGGVRCASGAEI